MITRIHLEIVTTLVSGTITGRIVRLCGAIGEMTTDIGTEAR